MYLDNNMESAFNSGVVRQRRVRLPQGQGGQHLHQAPHPRRDGGQVRSGSAGNLTFELTFVCLKQGWGKVPHFRN